MPLLLRLFFTSLEVWLASRRVDFFDPIHSFTAVTLLVPPATDNDSRVCRLDQRAPLEKASWVSPYEYDIRSPKPYCSILS